MSVSLSQISDTMLVADVLVPLLSVVVALLLGKLISAESG